MAEEEIATKAPESDATEQAPAAADSGKVESTPGLGVR